MPFETLNFLANNFLEYPRGVSLRKGPVVQAAVDLTAQRLNILLGFVLKVLRQKGITSLTVLPSCASNAIRQNLGSSGCGAIGTQVVTQAGNLGMNLVMPNFFDGYSIANPLSLEWNPLTRWRCAVSTWRSSQRGFVLE